MQSIGELSAHEMTDGLSLQLLSYEALRKRPFHRLVIKREYLAGNDQVYQS